LLLFFKACDDRNKGIIPRMKTSISGLLTPLLNIFSAGSDPILTQGRMAQNGALKDILDDVTQPHVEAEGSEQDVLYGALVCTDMHVSNCLITSSSSCLHAHCHPSSCLSIPTYVTPV
jgi:hypothetical protein